MALHDGGLILAPDSRKLLSSLKLDSLERCLSYSGGEVVKAARPNREVVRAGEGGDTVYIKRIQGRAWKEIPHECAILHYLHCEGFPVPEPLALGTRKGAGVLVTRALQTEGSLEDLLLRSDPDPERLRVLVARLAGVVRRLHELGVNHRDLYAGHVHVDGGNQIYVVDWGRAQRRSRVPEHRRRKDLAALHFSIPERIVPLPLRLRFLLAYLGPEASKQRVEAMARAIHRKSLRMRRHGERMLRRGAGNFHINR